jgi:hypothetical protein
MDVTNSDIKKQNCSNELINYNDLAVQCSKFKNANIELQNNGKIIEDTVKKYTMNEVAAVENAVKALNKKIETIIEHPKLHEYKAKSENLQKEMFSSLEYVIRIFEKFRKKTIDRKDLTSEQKMNHIKLAFEKIQTELFTPEDITKFKQQFSEIITILPRKTSFKNRKQINN